MRRARPAQISLALGTCYLLLGTCAARRAPVPAPEQDFRLPIFNWTQRTALGRFDPLTPMCLLMLSIAGIFFIYSAQVYHGRDQYVQQILWMFLGAVAYLVV